MEVTLESIFGELLEEYPDTEEVLKKYLGAAYCLSCPGKSFDNIGNGAALHGLSDEEAENMVDDLQAMVDEYEAGTHIDIPRDETCLDELDHHDVIGGDFGHVMPTAGSGVAGASHTHEDGTVHEGEHHGAVVIPAGIADADTEAAKPTKEDFDTWFKDIDTSGVNIDHMFAAAATAFDDDVDEEDDADITDDEHRKDSDDDEEEQLIV